jgi:hypothetical protein
MVPRFVSCDRCGLRALVRVSTAGRVSVKRNQGEIATQIIDCPSCGVHEQTAQEDAMDMSTELAQPQLLSRNSRERQTRSVK